MPSGHHGLVCHSCGKESSLETIKEESVTRDGTLAGLFCPICGNGSFGI